MINYPGRQVFGLVLSVLAVTIVACPAGAQDIRTIEIHTEAWPDYTNRDGTGFAWDILRAVYNPSGVELEKVFVPYSRAVRDVVEGEADAWIGSYGDENANALYPTWHYDADRLQALFPKEQLKGWRGPWSLRGRRVGWVRGYEYDKYLDVGVSKVLLKDRSRVVMLLRTGRINFWLDAAYEIENLLKSRGDEIDRSRYVRRNIMNQKLYMAFADNRRGRYLRDIWDRRLPRLLESGRLAVIYDRWNMDVWPFAQSRGESMRSDEERR